MKILVTGANGFVGKFLTEQLLNLGHSVFAATRSKTTRIDGVDAVEVGEIDGQTNWSSALIDVDVVIHLAARVHVMTECAASALAEFCKVNVDGTRHLAESAALAGVKRFVYVSSVKVNGEQTTLPYTELNEPNPQDAYGASKWEAEQVLQKILAETKMEYGSGVKGNFSQMIKVLAKGIPLPLAMVKNLRSFIYVENLVDALILCAMHPSAAGQIYLVNDGQDVSTPDLLRKLSSAMGCSARLLPCPLALMRFAGRLFGKTDQIDKLVGSLQVDSSKIRRELGWKPPFTLDEGIKATVSTLSEKR
jgi:nucleoside-diphosphate-sugar epimerase